MSAKAAAAPASDAAAPKKSKKLLIIAGAVVLLAGGGGAGWFFSRPHAAPTKAELKAAEEAEAAAHPAQYFALTPAFVINLADQDATRYMQADVQLMTHDEETMKALELHAPAIRNRLLLLFGQQSAAQLAQRSAKERLQDKALAEVKAALKAEAAPDKVEAVLFTSLVTQ